MKKILLNMLAVAFAIGLAACNSGDKPAEELIEKEECAVTGVLSYQDGLWRITAADAVYFVMDYSVELPVYSRIGVSAEGMRSPRTDDVFPAGCTTYDFVVKSLVYIVENAHEKGIGHLEETQWRLDGFREKDAAEYIWAFPRRDSCYTLKFHSDGILSGWTTTNQIQGRFRYDSESKLFGIEDFGGTERDELREEGDMYRMAMSQVHSYSATERRLILYYGVSGFLTFSRLRHDGIPRNLDGTKWELEKMVVLGTGEEVFPTIRYDDDEELLHDMHIEGDTARIRFDRARFTITLNPTPYYYCSDIDMKHRDKAAYAFESALCNCANGYEIDGDRFYLYCSHDKNGYDEYRLIFKRYSR